MKRTREIVGTFPIHVGRRPLINEPLTADDWRCVWLACQGFYTQIHLIVDTARKRAAPPPVVDGTQRLDEELLTWE